MRTAALTAPKPRPRRAPVQPEQTRSFLRMVGHELRTPLNSILGFSEILAAELYGPLGAPQYREYAEIIHDSGKRLLRLVDQVMEIARLESGSIEWDLGPEPLEPAFDQAVQGLADAIEARRTRIEVAGRGAMPTVIADARGLKNVLLGLIHNAVVFSPEGSTVRIRALRRNGTVQLVIANDGEGVDPAELPRLVQPFVQGQNALTRDSHGAGLGLSICALTCQAMGGRLTLTSARGRGLTARVQLPAA